MDAELERIITTVHGMSHVAFAIQKAYDLGRTQERERTARIADEWSAAVEEWDTNDANGPAIADRIADAIRGDQPAASEPAFDAEAFVSKVIEEILDSYRKYGCCDQFDWTENKARIIRQRTASLRPHLRSR